MWMVYYQFIYMYFFFRFCYEDIVQCYHLVMEKDTRVVVNHRYSNLIKIRKKI